MMDLYNSFNAVEAGLWFVVAVVIAVRVSAQSRQQHFAIVLASGSFIAVGISDLFEIGRNGHLPLWVWGWKICCGTAILVSRYTWLGWNRFHWRDREFLFGVGCLIAVMYVICVERYLYR